MNRDSKEIVDQITANLFSERYDKQEGQ